MGTNDYRIELVTRDGVRERDHVDARTAQEAADKIRADWPGCYISRIAMVVRDWH